MTNAGLTTNAAYPSAEGTIAVTTGSGASLKVIEQNNKKLKIANSTSGTLNVSASTSESAILEITVNADCTLSFSGKGSTGDTDWPGATNINAFSVDTNTVWSRPTVATGATETSGAKNFSNVTVSISAGTHTIKASGITFTALSCE